MSEATESSPPMLTLQVSNAITATDHGQIVVLVAWLCFTAGILLSMVRAYIRWPLHALAGKDDIAYAVSTVFAIVQTAVTLNTVRNGFGETESELKDEQVLEVAKALYATDLIFILSVWMGKISVSFLFSRLAKESNKSRLGWILTGLSSVLGFVSLLTVAIRPNAAQPWTYRESDVSSNISRWIAAGLMSIITDVIVTGTSIYLVWDLNMQSKSKSLVITAFTLRLFVTPVTIVRLVTLGAVRPDDFSFTYSLPEAMTQLEMYCSLVATTLPCLRLFLTAWNTSFMDMRLEEIDNNAYREHVTLSGSGSKGSASRSGGFSKHSASRTPRATWAPSSGKSNAIIEGGQEDRDDDAVSESSQKAIVIKRSVAVTTDGRQQ